MEGSSHVINPFEAIKEQLERLDQFPVTSEGCIYRVPHRLRRLNEAAYIPKVVSIGPLHHENEDLKKMERKKMRCLKHFLQITNVNLWVCTEIVKERVGRLRNCYEEELEFTNEQLVPIILVDAVFVITLLTWWSGDDEFNNYHKLLLHDVHPELLLLENQLPFFILEDLSNFALRGSNNNSLIICCHKFFVCFGLYEGKREYLEKIMEENYKPDHLLDLLRKFFVPLNLHDGEALTTIHIPSVTELHQAGAKLAVGSSNNLFDISFTNGILEIPKLKITDSTESILRNLIAFEQCHVRKGNYICDYRRFMDFLVNTTKDVDLLAHNEIIVNWLGDSSDVATMINKTGRGVMIDPENFYFGNLFRDLDSYHRTQWHKWKATLNQSYFNSPWAIISIIAAGLLIMLTIIQTICSVISTINGD